MKRFVVLFACSMVGCNFGRDDAKVPGDELGSYRVVATLESSSCGPGALGSKDLWEFDVKLSRDGNDLYWLNGKEVIPGTIASDDISFAFDSGVVVPVIPPGKGELGCSIKRTDTASGRLSSSSTDVTTFKGTMRYGFQPLQGGDCQGLIGVEGGFYALPCEMNYGMNATRTSVGEPGS